MAEEFLEIAESVARWVGSCGNERANFQQFASELTKILGVDAPKAAAADAARDDCHFERPGATEQIASARRSYNDWWQALSCVRDEMISGGTLREVEVTAAMPKARPWNRPVVTRGGNPPKP